MKREDVLSRLGYSVPAGKQIRVIVHSDVKNEADDPFAIVHHLLTPSFDVRCVIAAHFEGRYIQGKRQAEAAKAMALKNPAMLKVMMENMGMDASALTPLLGRVNLSMEDLPDSIRNVLTRKNELLEGEGTSLQQSYDELLKVMDACKIEDVPMLKGCSAPLESETDTPISEGVQFIIQEAMREDRRPLYILLQGCLTDLAAALNAKPEIAERMTAVWIGGGAYPKGGNEFNLMQDIHAARAVFASPITLWQIPANVSSQMSITFADLALKVKPCGAIGRYLFDLMLETNQALSGVQSNTRRGENWCLGDQPTAGVLLQSEDCGNFHMECAPQINDDFTYTSNPGGKAIRVYDSVDARMTLDDFYAKLQLCCGEEA